MERWKARVFPSLLAAIDAAESIKLNDFQYNGRFAVNAQVF
jgi:hypothetical protein